MKYYIYVEPLSAGSSEPVYVIMSETGVLAEQGAKFYAKFYTELDLEETAERQRIIDDWCTVHWASELTPEFINRTFFNHGQ